MSTATARMRTPLRASRAAGADPEERRPIRVARGERPPHSGLTPFQRWAWKTFRDRAAARAPPPNLEENLLKAHMRIRADEYLATVYAQTLIAAIALAVVGIGLFVFFWSLGLTTAGLVLAPLLPLALTPATYVALLGTPASRARSRAKAIDRRISVAMNFMSAMASADVNIDQIFRELGRQKRIYGEVSEEAAWVTRDTELLGVDILSAIKDAATRSPSKRFQDFLQGVVTTATSGGQLKPYFLLKAEQYEREHKLELQQQTETMGLMSEVFVITVVAFPLFLMIILAVFAIIGGNGAIVLTFIWLIVALVIPVIEGMFIFVMRVIAQEA